MKWIGAIMILFTCTWVGIDIARNYSKRPKQIRELLQALQIMEAEIVYAQEPIHRVLSYVSKQLSPPVSYIFHDLSEQLMLGDASLQSLWEDVVSKQWRQTAMKAKEKEVVLQFGQSLGLHNIEQQQKQIQLAKVHLQHELEAALEDEKRFSGMFRTLGVLSGLLFVLIFI
ncbi:stage III sporulation protein SpoIIIAB [Alkalibacillus haloalkaliphilus]|uniref:Stage III sporulation protein SpoAB n=2 Tax=Bacillaceae TaxID=186817 RepID=A0A511W2P3_9BACI|nr:stage III sporulation protein SpoIIIAB [Alkalibacillus haloalkaliphilus]MDV2580958.1 stage III sporulation protein SpoIIIAB [Alkalibacillus haloalkaliphilus]GEN45290.1 stage III sporulation protein SpoAB [Alkalibacillus haloalkaliphilus]